MSGHGYNPYTAGCRCEVCRQAKSDYMRAARAAARALAQKHTKPGVDGTIRGPGAERYIAPYITHGTVHGYTTSCCRCFECTDARSANDLRQRRKAS